MLLFNESDLIFYSDMIKMIQYEEKVYTDIVLFLHFYVYFIKTIDGPRGIDKKNSQFLLNVYFNTPIFFSKVICFTQLAFFHKLNSIVKRVSSVVVLFLRYFAGMKKPQKMKLQTILFFLIIHSLRWLSYLPVSGGLYSQTWSLCYFIVCTRK